MLLELVFLLLVILLMLNTAVVYLLAVKERGREEAYEAIKVDTGKSMRESQKVVPPRRPSTVGVLYVAPYARRKVSHLTRVYLSRLQCPRHQRVSPVQKMLCASSRRIC